MELLVAWGVANAAGFIFKPILEEIGKLATATLEDYMKEIFSASLKNSDFSRDVEREEWFASSSGEPLPHHFLYLEVSSSKSFKPWLRVSMERAKASILALWVICSHCF